MRAWHCAVRDSRRLYCTSPRDRGGRTSSILCRPFGQVQVRSDSKLLTTTRAEVLLSCPPGSESYLMSSGLRLCDDVHGLRPDTVMLQSSGGGGLHSTRISGAAIRKVCSSSRRLRGPRYDLAMARRSLPHASINFLLLVGCSSGLSVVK